MANNTVQFYLRRPASTMDVQRYLFGNMSTGNATAESNTLKRNQDVGFLLFLLFIFFGLLFVTVRMLCYWRQRVVRDNERGDPRFSVPREYEGRHVPRKPKTQEFIQKRLLVKNVFWVKSADEQLDKSRGFKSNLMIEVGKEEEQYNFSCSICLCEYENGDQICWSNNEKCPHHFHATCAVSWFAKHEGCPICRADYLVSPEKAKAETLSEEEVAADTPVDSNVVEIVEDGQGLGGDGTTPASDQSTAENNADVEAQGDSKEYSEEESEADGRTPAATL